MTTTTKHIEEARSAAAAALNAYLDGNANVLDEATRLAGTLALVDIAESLGVMSGRTA